MTDGDEAGGRPGGGSPPRDAEGKLVHVELDLLEDNPYQPRTWVDEETLEALCASIAANGLLQPIALRPRPAGRYQIVAGHRRVTAFRRLRDRATSEEERRRYERIPGLVLPELTDTQLAISAFVENGQRQDLGLLEEAGALARIRDLLAAQTGREATARDVAAAVGSDEKRVRRLFQLHHAPQVVKDGVAGLPPPAEEGSALPPRDSGRLNLMSAIEFARLHKHFAQRTPARADEKVRRALSRSLREGWGLRKVQAYVDGVLAAQGGGARRTGGPSLFRRNERELVVRTAKLATATPGSLRALHSSLRELLQQVEEHLAARGEPFPRDP